MFHCVYLKLFYIESSPAAEPFADDVVTLVLDTLVSDEGFSRTQNPISTSTPISIPIAMEFGCGLAAPWVYGFIPRNP